TADPVLRDGDRAVYARETGHRAVYVPKRATLRYSAPRGESLLSKRKNSETSKRPKDNSPCCSMNASRAGSERGDLKRASVRCGAKARPSGGKPIFSIAVSTRLASSPSAGGASIPVQSTRGRRASGKKPNPLTST